MTRCLFGIIEQVRFCRVSLEDLESLISNLHVPIMTRCLLGIIGQVHFCRVFLEDLESPTSNLHFLELSPR